MGRVVSLGVVVPWGWWCRRIGVHERGSKRSGAGVSRLPGRLVSVSDTRHGSMSWPLAAGFEIFRL